MALTPDRTETAEDDPEAADYRETDTPRLADDQQNAAEYSCHCVVRGLRNGPIGTFEEPPEHRLKATR